MGEELNEVTHTFNYQAFSGYAVIFFSQNQAAVIKSSQVIICGTEFETSCLSIFNFKGKDQGGREWEICTSLIC